MASEPNNAEENLKQYAAERRQQVPQEIHPATRRILQGEVARAYGSPEEERRARVRIRWMQALAWLVVAAAIPLFLLPRNPGTAQSPNQQKETALPTVSAPGQAPIILSDSPAPVVSPEAATAARSRDAKQLTEVKRQEPAAPAGAAMMKAKAEAEASVEHLSFNNNSGNPPVLKQFQMQQTGASLTFVDADQSTYTGRVLSQQGAADNFSAAGLNRTLNRRVVFTGQVVRALAPAAVQQQLQNNTANAAQNVQNNAQNISVQGNALVGDSQFKVDAQLAPTR